jgi:phospholipase C
VSILEERSMTVRRPPLLFTLLTAFTSLGAAPARADDATSPIQHLVVIFQENVSFDHYFATYPHAANPMGEPEFHAKRGTPTVNGLGNALLHANPSSSHPFRFDRKQAATCDQDHSYGDEQKAFHAGLMDLFPEVLGNPDGSTDGKLTCQRKDVMGYFDGNTVTALWNYAQHFAMSDNSFGTGFGPSTPGAVNLVSGNTHGASAPLGAPESDVVAGTVIGDPRPFLDDCSPGGGHATDQIVMSGRNVGDLLEEQHVTWGWFQGGFKPTSRDAKGNAVCGATHTGSDGLPKGDYIPHHEPFQYYPQTVNPHHLPPTSVAAIGHDDQANHQYDLEDFWKAVDAGHFPAVSFLKAAGFQDGHAGYSDPLAEQTFVVETINRLERRPEWKHTAVIIAYDDSDGFYDHVMGPIVSTSSTPQDQLTGPGSCGAGKPGAFQGRCGYGPRLPLLVVSPWAKENFVDHGTTDQSSILRFIEDNWKLGRIGGGSFDAIAGELWPLFDFDQRGRHPLFLDPSTGEVVAHEPDAE